MLKGKKCIITRIAKGFSAIKESSRKGGKSLKKENLNLARLPVPPRGQLDNQYVTNELRSQHLCLC